MRIMSSIIELPEMRIISQEVSPGRTVPRIYLFTTGQKLDYDILKALCTSFDTTTREERQEGKVNIPLYFIREIEPVPHNPHQVIVGISIAHHDFEKTQQPERVDNAENIIFRLKVSISSLTLLRAMFRLDDGAVWYIRGGMPLDLPYQTTEDITDVPPLFSVSFPPESMSSIWEFLDDALLNISTGPYADSADSQQTGAPYSIRVAQQEILRALLALTSGDVEESRELMNDLLKSYRMDANNQYTPRGFRADVSNSIRDLVLRSYMLSFPHTGHMDDEMSIDNDEEPRSQDDEDMFAELMQANGLDDMLREVVDSEPTYVADPSDTDGITDPIRHGIPLSMLSITAELEEKAPHILDMCRWDFSRESVRNMALENHSESDIAHAMIITVALRTARLLEVNGREDRRFIFLVRLLSLGSDPYPWELASFNQSLLKNDTQGFQEMLSVRIPQIEAPHNALYVIPSLLAITRVLDSEGWTLENLDSRLSRIRTGQSSTATVRSLLACLIDRDSTIEDGDEALANSVQRACETYDIEFLATNIANIILMLADLHVADTELRRGSDEWLRIRRSYINNLVGSASIRLARRLGGGVEE